VPVCADGKNALAYIRNHAGVNIAAPLIWAEGLGLPGRRRAAIGIPYLVDPHRVVENDCFSAQCQMAESHRVPYGALSVVRRSACEIRKTLS